ncbi:MAG: hypothetical protein ACJAYC_003921 [Halieaceae bacterium]|jgi:hypothetical protein
MTTDNLSTTTPAVGEWNWLSCPARRPELRVFSRQDGWLTVDSKAHDGEAVTLNEMAAEIWSMSDGLTSVQAMAGLLGRQCGITPAELESPVLDALIRLHKLGLLRDPVARTDLMRLTFAPGHGVGMGFFAAFHYIWEMLGRIEGHWAWQVRFLDEHGTDLCPELFHREPAVVESEGARVFGTDLCDFKRYSQAPADLFRQDGEPAVRLHRYLTAKQGEAGGRFASGQRFQQRFRNRNARHSMHLTVSRVIRPSQAVISECVSFSRAAFSDFYTLGVHLRSARYMGVDLSSKRYIREWAIPEIESTLAAQGQPDGRVFIATDVSEYVELCRDHFGDRQVVRDIPRVTDAGEDWYRLQSTRLDLWRNVLIDALLLAKCDFVMGASSNVLAAALIFNPHSDFKIFDFALERNEGQATFNRP